MEILANSISRKVAQSDSSAATLTGAFLFAGPQSVWLNSSPTRRRRRRRRRRRASSDARWRRSHRVTSPHLGPSQWADSGWVQLVWRPSKRIRRASQAADSGTSAWAHLRLGLFEGLSRGGGGPRWRRHATRSRVHLLH